MAHLSAFKRDQVVVACMAGASVTKTNELFGLVRNTVSRKRKKGNLRTEANL